MTYAALLNTLGSYERQFGIGDATACAAPRRCKKHDAIAFDNLFSGDRPSMGAAAYIVAPITYLMGNDYEKVDIEGARPHDRHRPRSRGPRRSSACGSTIRVRAPAAPCR